jgi:hypothetical protein
MITGGRFTRAELGPWPVECWIPGLGWMPWMELSEADERAAVRFCDRVTRGREAGPPSRWTTDVNSIEIAAEYGVVAAGFHLQDYPPGPRDDPMMYGIQWWAVGESVLCPMDKWAHGQRVWKSLVVGRDLAELQEKLGPRPRG